VAIYLDPGLLQDSSVGICLNLPELNILIQPVHPNLHRKGFTRTSTSRWSLSGSRGSLPWGVNPAANIWHPVTFHLSPPCGG